MMFKGKSKKFRDIYWQLRLWYGDERAEVEGNTYNPEPKSIADESLKLLAKAASPEIAALMQLKEHWRTIAGAQIAAVAEPLRINDGKVYIRVNHSIWLRELSGSCKQQLVKNIKLKLGDKFCHDLVFMP